MLCVRTQYTLHLGGRGPSLAQCAHVWALYISTRCAPHPPPCASNPSHPSPPTCHLVRVQRTQDDDMGELDEGSADRARGTADISAFGNVLQEFLDEQV